MLSKTITIPRPECIRGPEVVLSFEKEYQFAGFISSLNWTGNQHILGDESIFWLGAQSGGADFKGVTWNGSLIGCELKLSDQSVDVVDALTQALKGTQQVLYFLEKSNLKVEPKACDLFCIFPKTKGVVDDHPIEFSLLKEATEKKYSELLDDEDKSQQFKKICALPRRAHLVEVDIQSKKGAFVLTTNPREVRLK